jgi:nucleoside-diphosphate kinase
MPVEKSPPWLFVATWFDPQPRLEKRYLMKYWKENHKLELVDLKSSKLFLKKSDAPSQYTSEHFRVGTKLFIYGREIFVADYGDGKTRNALHRDFVPSIAIIPDSDSKQWGQLVEAMSSDPAMRMSKVRTVYIDPATADRVVAEAGMSPQLSSLLSGHVCLVCVFNAEGGPDSMTAISQSFPQVDMLVGGPESTPALISICDAMKPTATLDNCTCAIVKPHVLLSNHQGQVLRAILEEGYELSALETLHFDRNQAEEFLEVYREVVPEYAGHVDELISGPCLALELRAMKAVETFRETVGPWDIEMARELRPGTLRARFGIDKVRSAVHCTDLPMDGVTECEYCFQIMA